MILSPHQSRLLKRLLFLLVPYTILRIGFYFYHLNIYKQFSQDEIFQSLILGIRFDIAAICWINAPIAVLSFLPFYNKYFQKFERTIFILLNSIAFLIAIDDYELFLFMGKRLSYDLFVITPDIIQQLPQLIQYYWYLPLIAIFMGMSFYYFDKKFFRLKRGRRTSFFKALLVGLIIHGLMFVGIRGGLQHKSINVQSAFTQGKNELGHLVLNSPYHFLRTVKNTSPSRVNYFASDDEAKNIILNQRDFRDGIVGKPKANVVLIILESFALEYIEKGYAPFLTELMKKSMVFTRHLSNGRRSIESLPSLFCGLPSLLDEPISKSNFQGNRFTCMPKVLKEAGYTNYFFHAGARGTMGFDSYALANGFDRYFSRYDYGKQDFDGTWGTFDGPYLKFTANEISKMPEPFLAGIFTLSSHQPYAIPKEFSGRFPKGTLEIHESIGYADFALREFFNKVEKEKWYNNTLFIITADHSQKLESKKFLNLLGHFRVPLILFYPGMEPQVYDKVTQHSDIPRTVLDFVEIKNDELAATSVSVFSSDTGAAINYADGSTYFMARKLDLVILDKNGKQTRFAYDWDTGESLPVKDDDTLLKAYIQYFINGLINNNLSLYR